MKLIIRAICMVKLIAMTIKYLLSESEDVDAEQEDDEKERPGVYDPGFRAICCDS